MDRREILLRWLREEERGPSWLARQLGMSREWISAVLNGRKPVSDRLAARITRTIGLRFDEGIPASPAPVASGIEDSSEDADLIINPEPRCPCVVVVDAGLCGDRDRRADLERGIERLASALRRDALTGRRAEIAFVTFDEDARAIGGFASGQTLADTPPNLPASGAGATAGGLARGLELALRLLDARRSDYDRGGIEVYRPWVVLLQSVDVAPGDPVLARAREALLGRERAGLVSFFAVGAGGHPLGWLEGSGLRAALTLRDGCYEQLFEWLAASLARVSSSIPGDRVRLPSTESFAMT